MKVYLAIEDQSYLGGIWIGPNEYTSQDPRYAMLWVDSDDTTSGIKTLSQERFDLLCKHQQVIELPGVTFEGLHDVLLQLAKDNGLVEE